MTTLASASNAGGVLDVSTARPRLRPWRLAASAVVVLLLARGVVFLIQTPGFEWDVVAEYLTFPTVLRGLGVTIAITIACTTLSILVGAPVALCRLSAVMALRALGAGYVWLFRGLPALVQIVFWFNLAYLLPEISLGIPFGPTFASWSTNRVVSPFVAALLGLGLTEGAFMAEIIRAGILSIDPGQRDAARSLGLGARRTFFQVVAPQAMRVIVPPMGSQVIGLAKSTSLVSVVATTDLLFSVEVVYSRTFQVIPLLVVACVWYLALVSILFVLQVYLERRFSRGRAASAGPGVLV
jgi:polar amino acid transport system permease protein